MDGQLLMNEYTGPVCSFACSMDASKDAQLVCSAMIGMHGSVDQPGLGLSSSLPF